MDASCGIGHDISCLLQHGFEVDGTDISPEMISEAKKRLGLKYSGKLMLADIRQLSLVIKKEKYDCVIFRGNTFSNVRPSEIQLVISEITKVLKKNGIICIDFRDSSEQLKLQGTFELRGNGYNKYTKKFFLSYYKLTHSKNINDPYKVNAHVWYGPNLSVRNFIRHSTININSHYVDANLIMSTVIPLYHGIQSEHVERVGLPFLKTFLGRKK